MSLIFRKTHKYIFIPFLSTAGYDCGVFVCMYAYFLSVDVELEFSQDDILLGRQIIGAKLLRCNMEVSTAIESSENDDDDDCMILDVKK